MIVNLATWNDLHKVTVVCGAMARHVYLRAEPARTGRYRPVPTVGALNRAVPAGTRFSARGGTVLHRYWPIPLSSPAPTLQALPIRFFSLSTGRYQPLPAGTDRPRDET
jgi:hypothetical protein